MSDKLKQKKGLYVITDCDHLNADALLTKTENILKMDVSIVQYRDKKNHHNEKLELALQLNELCQEYETPFIINDDISLAKQTNASGVHLGKDDVSIEAAREYLSNKIIGASCYNDFNKALQAKKAGADYIAFGSFYSSITKPKAVQAHTDLLTQAQEKLNLPIVAIGGITPDNGKELVQSGADYLAIISGIYQATDIKAATEAYKNCFKTD